MHKNDIKEGETYIFIGSDSPARKHLSGQAFTVIEKKHVFRRTKKGQIKKSLRLFNEDGVGARAEELGELPADWCPDCKEVQMKFIETIEGRYFNEDVLECSNCGHKEIVKA